MFELNTFAAVFTTLLVLVVLAGFWRWDETVAQASKKILGHREWLDRFFRLFSFTPFVVAVLFIAPVIYSRWHSEFISIYVLTINCTLALGAAFVGKYIFRRARPFHHLTYIGQIDSSFPSGHTAGSFAAAFMLAFTFPSLATPALLFATLVALSRIYLQLHFISDVAGGVLLAYVFTLFIHHSDFINFLGLV